MKGKGANTKTQHKGRRVNAAQSSVGGTTKCKQRHLAHIASREDVFVHSTNMSRDGDLTLKCRRSRTS